MSITVCIAGMHRTGTSLVSQLLSRCGINLGSAEDFARPASDNPEGFWENLQFVRLNEQILARFEGAWDFPPTLESGWENSPQLLPLRSQAAQVIQTFNHTEVWGWKDPRNSLTFSFWQLLIPNLKVLICLRDPLSVAASLRKRSCYASDQFGFNLWEHYYRAILSQTQSHNRIITHYDSYFFDVRDELTRIFNFLEIDVAQASINAAGQSVSAELRHHDISTAQILESALPVSSKKLYLDLCAAAGPVYQLFSLKHDKTEPKSWASISDDLGPEYVYALQEKKLLQQIAQQNETLAALKEQLAALQQELLTLQAVLKERDASVEAMEKQLAHLQQELLTLQAVLKERDVTITTLEDRLAMVQGKLQLRKNELAAIYGSRAWQLAKKLQQLYAGIIGRSHTIEI